MFVAAVIVCFFSVVKNQANGANGFMCVFRVAVNKTQTDIRRCTECV